MIYLKDTHMARDIVQQVYIKLWSHRDRMQSIHSLDDYLFILVRNTVFDHLKKIMAERRRLAVLHRIPEGQDTVMAYMEERECRHLLHQSVSRLPARQKEVYLLASEQEMSHEEIADSLQVSRLTVKRHLELARRFVRRYIHHHLHGQSLIPFCFLLYPYLYAIHQFFC
jgi:RNA polymerase sigma-70 factor (ECF subfamily)